MKGFLVIDDISLEEAKEIMKKLRKRGRWLSESGMMKIDNAASFAMLTHGFPEIEKEEVYEFGDEEK